MAKNLVIVESPAKAKTINKILGPDYVVKASMGHVRDLPERKLGVDIDKGFKPQYEVSKDRNKIIKELVDIAAKAEAIYLAPDPDREGEAIAWHLKEILKKKVDNALFHRVSYNEITPTAVREAFAHPRSIDMHRVDAQQARRVLDRIVGYKVSPLLWSRVKRGLSAGRVQSVALRLVCEREEAIRNFVPEPYWLVGAVVRKLVAPTDPFNLRLAQINGEKASITSEEQAKSIMADLEPRSLRVKQIIRRELTRRAMPPFITSTLQQGASRVYDYSPSRTMKIAQKLYEGVDLGDGPVGLITYMRTDSFTLSADAIQSCRGYIAQTFGNEFVPEKPNIFRNRSSAQEAHEAIRPTDVTRTPDAMAKFLAPEELKLYRLIWQRFVASQMAPARIAQLTAEIEAVPPAGAISTYLFRATASQVVFPGYMKVSGMDAKLKEKDGDGNGEEEEIEKLPPLEEGEMLERLEWLSERKETQPPGRYSEASLIRALEEDGVGRPSTYAQILATLINRTYVTKEKRSLAPTALGMQVNTYLVKHLDTLFDVQFTAGMEASLDEVENGSVEWTAMLGEFYAKFIDWMEKAKGPDADPSKVNRLLELLQHVKTWGPENQRGKRTYSDKKFVDSIQKQVEQKKKPLSVRQLEVLAKLALRYRDQIPELESALAQMQIEIRAEPVPEPGSGGSPEVVLRKLDMLATVTCDAPVERRGRTFDDRAFINSLTNQAKSGKTMSPAQMAVLDRLVVKYSTQIPEFETHRESLGLMESQGGGAPDLQSEPLLKGLEHVREWAPAVQREKKTLDDRVFYESLRKQFDVRKSLTPRQLSALKRLVRKYASQVPDYEALAARLNLGMPGAGGGKRRGKYAGSAEKDSDTTAAL